MVYTWLEVVYARLVEDGFCTQKKPRIREAQGHKCRCRSHFMNCDYTGSANVGTCECRGFMVLLNLNCLTTRRRQCYFRLDRALCPILDSKRLSQAREQQNTNSFLGRVWLLDSSDTFLYLYKLTNVMKFDKCCEGELFCTYLCLSLYRMTSAHSIG